ncbi:nuclear transport factor 2 family protein [Streptomyces sp. NPDC006654]|uniref:nuclear transport factor 2 family protein n=1 Tax=unclassified Streptomyces TaxID=2593676 RepID=UPI0033E68632
MTPDSTTGAASVRGLDGVRARDRTDNIGVQVHFTLDAIGPGPSAGTYVATFSVTGNGYNGTGPTAFCLRDGLIASLRIAPWHGVCHPRPSARRTQDRAGA